MEPTHTHWILVVKAVEREFVERRLRGGCFLATALAAIFIPNAEVIQGYCMKSRGSVSFAFTHVWMELQMPDRGTSLRVDLGQRIAKHWHDPADREGFKIEYFHTEK